MDEPQPLSAQGMAGNHMRNMRGGNGGLPVNIQSELMWIKQDANQVRNAVILLEQEKDSLRKAIRKLKLENSRMKQKMKNLQETVVQLGGTTTEDHNGNSAPEAEMDYDDINRDFFLVGGIHDPLSLRYEVTIRDANGVEHKSAERYYWYKMAETFGDTDAMKKILQSPNVAAAEEAMKGIQKFDEAEWDKVKLAYWEEGQRFKFDQVRWIANLLVLTKTMYLAVASQNKFFGTGWRKNRQESNKPIFWDGLNEGGKVLMNIRHEMKQAHTWTGPQEEEETQKKFSEMKRFVWRRVDPTKRMGVGNGGRGGMMMGRGGGRGYYPSNRARPQGGAPRTNATATASSSATS
jgi:ribA/ribD-fused uncharacterized protein